MVRFRALLAGIVVLLVWTGSPAAKERIPPAGLSGLAKIGPRTFAGVLDHKQADSKPRVRLLSVDADGTTRARLVKVTWGTGGVALDLEGVCALETPGEVLALESGQTGAGAARLLHIRGIRADASAHAIVAHETLVQRPRGRPQNLEGLACVPLRNGRVLTLFGERGGSPDLSPGLLRWAVWDPRSGSLAWEEIGAAGMVIRLPSTWSADPSARAIADLWVDPSHRLWAAGTVDPEGDVGPFRSIVYQAGVVEIDDTPSVRVFPRPAVAWIVDGFKVEGLAAPPEGWPRPVGFSFVTEDEGLGGAWRTLPPAPR